MNRRTPRALMLALLTMMTLLGIHSPVYADSPTSRHLLTLLQVITNLTTLAYLIGTAVVFYGISVLLTMAFARGMYPPNAARLGCWIGTVSWAAFVIFGLFGWLVPVLFFLWETIVVFSVILLFGIILLVTAKRSAR